jgi:hypothetical protein
VISIFDPLDFGKWEGYSLSDMSEEWGGRSYIRWLSTQPGLMAKFDDDARDIIKQIAREETEADGNA